MVLSSGGRVRASFLRVCVWGETEIEESRVLVWSTCVEEEEVVEGCYFGPWLWRCEELSLICTGGGILPEHLM
jgi:hypothetical protein